MGAIATFDYPTWLAFYPEFSTVGASVAGQYFAWATLFQANDGSGPVQDAGQQLLLLNMLTAHIAKLFALDANGKAPSGLVGRINSASMGSVSVTAEMQLGSSAQAQFMAQTRYGLSWWAAMSPYRKFTYIPGPQRIFDIGPYGYGNQWWDH
jgi:hypothetical protein